MNFLLEIKAADGELTIQEGLFRLGWSGQVDTVRTAQEAIAVVTRGSAQELCHYDSLGDFGVSHKER